MLISTSHAYVSVTDEGAKGFKVYNYTDQEVHVNLGGVYREFFFTLNKKVYLKVGPGNGTLDSPTIKFKEQSGVARVGGLGKALSVAFNFDDANKITSNNAVHMKIIPRVHGNGQLFVTRTIKDKNGRFRDIEVSIYIPTNDYTTFNGQKHEIFRINVIDSTKK